MYGYASPENLRGVLKQNPPIWCKDPKKTQFLNTPISFDIETTSFYNKAGEKCATMYIWMLDIYDKCIIGRTWDEFVDCINEIAEYYQTDKEKRIIIYVHNLSYEFQFMRKWFKWRKIFFVNDRKPIYAITENNIEFRCSYLLAGYSLAKVGEMLRNPIDKLDTLDYTKPRHFNTYLTDREIAYCIHDVKIVSEFIREKIQDESGICNIPLTKTGYVRRLCRARCLRGKGANKYRELMEKLQISPNEYDTAKAAFQGGFTHGNIFHINKTEKNVTSFDFTSSYPYSLISEMYPMSEGTRKDDITKEEFYNLIDNKCCIFSIRLENVKSKFIYESYISRSHCGQCENATINNGRVVKADLLETTITNVDFWIIQKVYDFKITGICNFYYYEMGYLPTELVTAILDLYEIKTKLKGIPGKEEEYLFGKENLNSIYGMMVTDIVRDEIEYIYELNQYPEELPEEERKERQREKKENKRNSAQTQIEKQNASKSRFIFYLWGVFCTAYSRFNLWTGIIECKNDYLYSDTDSIKILNAEKHAEYFERYNKNVLEKTKIALEYHGIGPRRASPKTIKGKAKPLGVWDFDGKYKQFKTLGAKRYLCEYENPHFEYTLTNNREQYISEYVRNHYLLTVAGLSKQNGIEYMFNKWGNNLFDHFTESLAIPAENTGKLTHTYIDKQIMETLTDLDGVQAVIHEKSFIHLSNAPYELGISEEFRKFIENYENILQ